MSEPIAITPETIPAVCERIEALLRGQAYRVESGRDTERFQRLGSIRRERDHFRIVDTFGTYPVSALYGLASIALSDRGFTSRQRSPGGYPLEWIFTLEDTDDGR